MSEISFLLKFEPTGEGFAKAYSLNLSREHVTAGDSIQVTMCGLSYIIHYAKRTVKERGHRSLRYNELKSSLCFMSTTNSRPTKGHRHNIFSHLFFLSFFLGLGELSNTLSLYRHWFHGIFWYLGIWDSQKCKPTRKMTSIFCQSGFHWMRIECRLPRKQSPQQIVTKLQFDEFQILCRQLVVLAVLSIFPPTFSLFYV